jgi:hypothetical protein
MPEMLAESAPILAELGPSHGLLGRLSAPIGPKDVSQKGHVKSGWKEPLLKVQKSLSSNSKRESITFEEEDVDHVTACIVSEKALHIRISLHLEERYLSGLTLHPCGRSIGLALIPAPLVISWQHQ